MRYEAIIAIYSLMLTCWALAAAQADQVNDYVKAQMQKRQIPGLSLAVVRDGKLVLARGYGLADVERNVHATPDTVYEIGSMTKSFTATAIMMLVEEGKIGLDEKINHYLPDLPATWKDVTIRHLLTHTSGIKSYSDMPEFPKLMRSDTTEAEIIRLVSGEPLEFSPGAKWAYGNTGFFLLGMILEKVSGKPYGEFLEERIFRPLGMTATRVNDLGAIIPNRASGYTLDDSTLRHAEYVSMTWTYSAGVLVSTVKDIAKWDVALDTDRLLKPSSLQQMWTPVKLQDGRTADYGFGWFVGGVKRHRRISHSGGIPGFVANISRFVDDKLTVIVLINTDQASPDAIAKGVAGIMVPALAHAAPEPIADQDPQATQHLRDVLTGIEADTVDPAQFTPEAQAFLFPGRMRQFVGLLQQSGSLRSFQPLEQKTVKGQRLYQYRAVFGDTDWLLDFVLTEESKIAEIRLTLD
jgi:CubicO group peptidase (beta-lactamase class C family)